MPGCHFLRILLFTLIGAAAVNGQATANTFRFLDVDGHRITTTHAARYEVKLDRASKLLGQFEHQPVYGGKQFNVSIAAFSIGVDLIMVHAETHTDGTGGLDYSKLTPAKLNGVEFTSREQCASADDNAELDANPEIQFLRKAGFDVRTPFFLKQFLTTSSDGKAEVVISYGRKVVSCDKVPDEIKRSIDREISRKIKVKKIA